MNLQQMEYIVALDKYRHFVLAAEACGVTQPTLSAMIQKLEEELDVKIFERSKKSVTPTSIGTKIIRQAQTALNETQRIREVVADEVGSMRGNLRIGITPTIAPYIVPDFIYHFRQSYPHMKLYLDERENKSLLRELEYGNLDLIITTSPLQESFLLEIPVFVERFVIYFSEACKAKEASLSEGKYPVEHMWVLKEEHCIHKEGFGDNKEGLYVPKEGLDSHKGGTFNLCNKEIGNHIYEAGSIETLIRIVDKNGGYTIIPELHTAFLTDRQKKQTRPLETVPPARRSVSIFLKEDFIRERAVNAVRETLKKIIPPHMIDERFNKHDIKLRRS